jgi:hypothetical protein
MSLNSMSLKEKAVASAMLMVLLYGALAAFWFVSAEKSWKKSARLYAKERDRQFREEKMIAERDRWTEAYEAEKSQMPTFDGKTSTDSEWIDKLDQLAKKHHILIGQLQSGKEIDAGEVLELPIEVRSWEGSLEALVRFMQELENTNEGMFNIRSLNFKPSSKKGYLRGSFTLTCAYMREG